MTNESSVAASQNGFFGRLLKLFRSAPPAKIQLAEPQVIARQYHYWRERVLLSSIIGYATFYFVRANLPIAMPLMERNLGIHKQQLGLFLTLHGLLYGVSKFANGFLGDRANARSFMSIGLAASAMLNVLFGFNSAAVALGVIWMINGWVQGMGFPPCARLLTHWFSPKELATKMSIWNTAHSIGAGAVVVLCGYLVDHFHNWRICFFVPAGLAVACAGLLLVGLRDTPESVGLPEVAGTHDADACDDFNTMVLRKVFANPYVWILSLANFFVYTIRYSVFDWGPTMLKESR